jgi:hypothetical protein
MTSVHGPGGLKRPPPSMGIAKFVGSAEAEGGNSVRRTSCSVAYQDRAAGCTVPRMRKVLVDQAISLTTDSIVVTIEMRPVAGIAAIHWSSASLPCRGAVCERSTIIAAHGLLLVKRFGSRSWIRCAVAMVVTSLAIIVTSFRV